MSALATLRIRERGSIVMATVMGEVDLSNSSTLTAELTGATGNEATGLLLDLSELEFLDSSGVQMLYALAERLANRQQSFAVALPPNCPPRRAIELSGAAREGWLHADAAGALAALAG